MTLKLVPLKPRPGVLAPVRVIREEVARILETLAGAEATLDERAQLGRELVQHYGALVQLTDDPDRPTAEAILNALRG